MVRLAKVQRSFSNNCQSTNAFMKSAFFLVTVMAMFLSCKKENVKPGEVVEIYLLKTFQKVAGKCQVDASQAVLQDTPTIKNQDILAYYSSSYQFKLTDSSIQKVKAFRDATPFAVTVDRQVVYFGFFKPNFSSSSCDASITMDIDWITGNQINLRLGYPGQMQGVVIDDKRNHPKLLETLKQQGKLF
jgi:hypothetical protein